MFLLTLFQSHTEAVGAGYTALMCIPQFLLPSGLGVFFLKRADRIANSILKKTGVHAEDTVLPVINGDFGGLAFSLLGVFMLASAIPGVLQDLAAWFQMKAVETTYMSVDAANFWRDRFPAIVYHIAALGFSLFVFLRAKSIATFVDSIRRAGVASAVPPEAYPDSSSGTDEK